MKNNKDFDKIISGKLENISPELSDKAWDSFQQYRDANNNFELLEFDMSFDDKIREQIKKIETGIPSGHWVALKNMLQLIEDRKRELMAGAFVQTIIVCLMIQLLLPEIQLKNQKKINEINYTGVTIAPFNKNVVTSGYQSSIYSEAGTEQESNLKSLTPLMYSSGLTLSVKSFADTSRIQSEAVAIQSGHDKISDASVNAESGKGFEFSVSDILISELQGPASEKVIPISENISYLSYKAENIDPYLVFNNEVTPASDENVAFVPLESRDNASYYSVTAFYSSDVNLINTPFDKVYSVASYTREAFNRSAGILFSMRKENISLETGARYTHLSYTPKIIKEEHNQVADIFFETSLVRISFKIIHIPLHLKYHFLNTRKWSGYLLIGAGFNLITESDFNITTNIRQGRNAGLRSPDQDLRLIEEKRFNTGIFEGGRIQENYFVTGALGFGLERHISGPLKIFTQAVYNRHLLSDDIGIGPNKDKIHSMSFQSGLKIIL